MKKFIFASLSLLLIFSCNSNDDELALGENDYLIFGHFYGFCIGENCIQTFKLTKGGNFAYHHQKCTLI